MLTRRPALVPDRGGPVLPVRDRVHPLPARRLDAPPGRRSPHTLRVAREAASGVRRSSRGSLWGLRRLDQAARPGPGRRASGSSVCGFRPAGRRFYDALGLLAGGALAGAAGTDLARPDRDVVADVGRAAELERGVLPLVLGRHSGTRSSSSPRISPRSACCTSSPSRSPSSPCSAADPTRAILAALYLGWLAQATVIQKDVRLRPRPADAPRAGRAGGAPLAGRPGLPGLVRRRRARPRVRRRTRLVRTAATALPDDDRGWSSRTTRSPRRDRLAPVGPVLARRIRGS